MEIIKRLGVGSLLISIGCGVCYIMFEIIEKLGAYQAYLGGIGIAALAGLAAYVIGWLVLDK